ncbi:MAG: phosphoglucosamine mutase [bacterium]
MTLKISISGIRGYVPESLTPEVCLDFAKAFGTYLNGGKVVIGIDSRATSEYIKGIIFAGLMSCGCEVIDLGICPTPTVGIMTKQLKAKGGIIVTASHNPLPWNGIKFVRADGIFLNEAQAGKFIKIYEGKVFLGSRGQRPGTRTLATGPRLQVNRTGIDFHIAKVLKAFDAALIKKKKFRVAVDACNGAGSVALVECLRKLGCTVYPINVNTSLPFPHSPEPIAENLGDLLTLVKTKKADIGFAMDADADRLAVVSEKGEALGEELTMALAVKFMLEQNQGKKNKIVINLSTTKAVDDLCQEFGAACIRTKVGEVNVAEKIKEVKALIGGEGNGGVIYPKIGFNRDSLTAATLLLNMMAESGQKLSDLGKAIPHYEGVKTKVECKSNEEASKLVEKTKQIFAGEKFDLTEGIKVIFPDAWIHVRPSNTEPIVRIIAEAKSKARAKELVNLIPV